MKSVSLSLAGLAVWLGAVAPASAQLFTELKGDHEFSGRLIARPIQEQEESVGRVTLDDRRRDAIEALSEYPVHSYVWQTDETIIDVLPGTENAVAAELLASGNFDYVEPDWIVFPIGCPDDPRLGNQWHHDANIMQSCDGWDLHTGNPSVGVGHCDTGIRTTHEDFQLHRLEAYNAVDQVWENNGGNIGPVHPHGTMVTGCTAANGDNGVGIAGVGWNLSHRMMRVSNQSSGSSSLAVLQHGARTSIEAGDRVASVSYSGVDNASNLSTATYIKSLGGLLCWSAGNDGRNLNFGNRDADDIIVCGATDSGDNQASFTAYGQFVDVMAPGVSVYTTDADSDSDYRGVSGTSFSCPLTAGICAMLFSYDPNATPDEVEQMLKEGCDDLGAPGVDNDFAYGRINLYNSLSLRSSLDFGYPNGRPDTLSPIGGTTMRVQITSSDETPDASTAMLHTNDGSGWVETPMVDLGSGDYDAIFPAFPGSECGASVNFYVSIDTTGGQNYTNPAGAPADAYEAMSFDGGVVIADLDFESSPGWTVDNVNLTDGAWDRGVPVGGGDRGDPATDQDGSGQCWLTDNADGNSDVDGGPTRLISPAYDLSGLSTATVSYARYFYNDDNDGDRLVVDVSANGGSSWTTVESVGNTGGWTIATFQAEDYVALNSQFRMRFSATDNPNDSVTEAGIDRFRIDSVSCSLALDASPAAPAAGDTLVCTTWKGDPGAPCLLTVSSIGGVPTFLVIDANLFNGAGDHVYLAPIPNHPALPGLEVKLISYGTVGGSFEVTNEETLNFQ